ncbi:MAG: sulfotransferase domain-containing protein [Gammaproteobacteria bacterium]
MVDFIGIGAARSGTTWISDVLRRHPDIVFSEPKEIRYFNRYVFPLPRKESLLNPNHDRGIDWYLRHFRDGGRVKGEYSPIYFFDESAPAAIARSFPRVKLICSLRNPADRAYSHYWLYRSAGMLPEMSFESAMEAEPVFLEMGYYARQLGRYLEHFDRKQILVLVLDDIVRDPAAEIARILQFLDVHDARSLDVTRAERNRPVQVRSTRVKLLAHAASRGMAAAGLGSIVRGLRKIGVHNLFRRIMSAGTGYPPMAAETRQRLIDTYAEDVTALERLLERDLGAWKTMPGKDL